MSRPVARFRPEAERDIDDIAEYIAGGSLDHALRFHAAVRADAGRLAGSPKLGPVYGLPGPTLADVRIWLVTGFRNYLMFYRPFTDGDGVEVIRVLHGARDIARVIKSS